MKYSAFPILAIAFFSSSCSTPDVSTVRARLEANEAAYRRAAEKWNARETIASFCYFPDAWYTPSSDEGYRVDDVFVQAEDNAYRITGAKGSGRPRAVTLEEAASLAGITARELHEWKQLASDLSIYCISKTDGYVEIMLRGSDVVPYGVRYVPSDQEDLFVAMRKQDGKYVSPDDTQFSYLFGRWFYFRSKR